MKPKYWVYIVIIAVILLIGFFFGWKIATGLAAAGAAAETKRRISNTDQQIKKAKKQGKRAKKYYDELKKQNNAHMAEDDKKIAEAGDNIEKKHVDNADDARNNINDFLDSNGGK